MKILNLTLALEIAGLLHLGLICAGAMMPGVVGMRSHLAALPPFIRRLFWVYYAFIGLCLVSFGTITATLAPALAAGGTLARAFCIFLAAFWTLRLVAATFIFDMRPYLTNNARRLGYHAINIVFVYLPIVYAWTAWKGGHA
jgi:FtsH-binding integral membrane protein